MSKAEWREGLSCEERDRAIESILDVALPACETSRGRMRENLAALSLRALFFGIEDCAILAVIVALAGAVPMAFMTEHEHSALAVFMLAPLVLRDASGPCCMEGPRKRNNRLACGMSHDGPRAPCGPHAGVWGDGDPIHRTAGRCRLDCERVHGLVLVDAVPCCGEPRDFWGPLPSAFSA